MSVTLKVYSKEKLAKKKQEGPKLGIFIICTHLLLVTFLGGYPSQHVISNSVFQLLQSPKKNESWRGIFGETHKMRFNGSFDPNDEIQEQPAKYNQFNSILLIILDLLLDSMIQKNK